MLRVDHARPHSIHTTRVRVKQAMSGLELFRWHGRYHANNSPVHIARLEHAKVLEKVKAAGLQDAIDCLMPDNISVEQKEYLWDPAHPRFAPWLQMASNTQDNYVSGMRCYVRFSDAERDNDYEVTEDAVVQHLEHVLIAQPNVQEPKSYCENRVAALQLLLVMQQGAVISPEEVQQLPHLNARGGRVHTWISTIAKSALWQARSRWARASCMVCVLSVTQ
jgi:hypothetical protein